MNTPRSQSRLDAEADAETLRLNVPEFDRERVYANLYFARCHGLKAVTEMSYAIKVDGRWSWEFHEESAVDSARRATRAVHRACPELRHE